MGRLLGIPMGVEVCDTNHADADQNSNAELLVLPAAAGCEYVMGVPESDDVMLNHRSTSHHDVASVRRPLDCARERGLSVGRPLAVRHCRVGMLDDVSVGEPDAPDRAADAQAATLVNLA